MFLPMPRKGILVSPEQIKVQRKLGIPGKLFKMQPNQVFQSWESALKQDPRNL